MSSEDVDMPEQSLFAKNIQKKGKVNWAVLGFLGFVVFVILVIIGMGFLGTVIGFESRGRGEGMGADIRRANAANIAGIRTKWFDYKF